MDEKMINDVAEIFKILGDCTRIRILDVLKEEMCVGKICEKIDMTKSAVSHQLRILRQAKIVKARKDGKEVYYSLDDEHVMLILACATEHMME